VRFPQAVQGELIFYTAALSHPFAHLVRQMKGIAHYAKANGPLFKQLQQLPKVGVQNGVAARQVYVGRTGDTLAKGANVAQCFFKVFKGGGNKVWVPLRKYITMLTSLVTHIGYVPLNSKIRFIHNFPLKF
jgi:hypothetical protein